MSFRRKKNAVKVFSYRCGLSDNYDTVCNSYTLAHSDRDLTLAVVCSRKEGISHFRGDVGARIAAENTVSSIKAFVSEHNTLPSEYSERDLLFKQLFSEIALGWKEAVASNSKSITFLEMKEMNIGRQTLDEFLEGKNPEEAYACTVTAFFRTATYWCAFSIGAGRCYWFQPDNPYSELLLWNDAEIPDDISLDRPHAEEKFRYCCHINGRFPAAVLLEDRPYTDCPINQTEYDLFRVDILKSLLVSTTDAVNTIRDGLHKLSDIRNGVFATAAVYEPDRMKTLLPELLKWQLGRINLALTEDDEKEHCQKLILRKKALREERDLLSRYSIKEWSQLKSLLNNGQVPGK